MDIFFSALGTAYIRFSFGFSVESLQPCQFVFVLFRGIKWHIHCHYHLFWKQKSPVIADGEIQIHLWQIGWKLWTIFWSKVRLDFLYQKENASSSSWMASSDDVDTWTCPTSTSSSENSSTRRNFKNLPVIIFIVMTNASCLLWIKILININICCHIVFVNKADVLCSDHSLKINPKFLS